MKLKSPSSNVLVQISQIWLQTDGKDPLSHYTRYQGMFSRTWKVSPISNRIFALRGTVLLLLVALYSSIEREIPKGVNGT
jgi:hypothetical protein